MNQERGEIPEKDVVIIGVGLIGGSVAAAVRQRFPLCRITGIGRSLERLQEAARRDLLHRCDTRVTADSVPPGSLVVVCLPVDQIGDQIRQIAAVCDDQTTITDAGSVKASLYSELQSLGRSVPQYVGAHPIAGGEKTGFEFAQADLFTDRVCVITPETASPSHVARVTQFWKSLGSNVCVMTADQHDRVLAYTSHLPHVLAAVAADSVTPEKLGFTGSGFRDTTRIAAGSAELWTRILLGNHQHAGAAIAQAQQRLAEYAAAVRNQDETALRNLLSRASEVRRRLKESAETPEA